MFSTPTFADIESVCALIAKQNINDYGEALITTNDLTKSWQSFIRRILSTRR